MIENVPWPPLYPETRQKLLEVYDSHKWSLRAKYEPMFCEAFAKYHDAKFGIAMVNGTVTLECAMRALGIGSGDEVIVPAITWIATGAAPIVVGARTVIVDVEPDTLCIDPAKIEEAITPRTKAIIPVHVFSSMSDMEKIMEIAEKHHLYVIEDCAHAHGGKWDGRGVGSIGHIGSFSFQQSKLMTGGEGGICLTSDPGLADRLERLSRIGTSSYHPSEFPSEDLVCSNYRMTEFQAAILYDQLMHLEEESKVRDENSKILADMLKDTPGIKLQASGRRTTFQSRYLHIFLLEPGIDRDAVLREFKELGIGGGTGWGKPIYKMVVWNFPKEKYTLHPCPVAEEACFKRIVAYLHERLLCNRRDIEEMARIIDKVMRKLTK